MLKKNEINILILPISRFGVADLLDIEVFLNEDYCSFS